MFSILQKIGSIISMLGTFSGTAWSAIKAFFSIIFNFFSAVFGLIAHFPIWLISILVFSALTSVILWVVYHDG